MKKMVSLLLTLCVFLSSAVFAFAEDKRDQPFEQRPYEVFPRRDVLYVDVDTAATDPDELIADLKQSGFVEDVISSGSSFAYPGEQKPGTAYLSVAVSAPCEKNNAAVRELLAEVPGVKVIYQPVLARLAAGDHTWSDLERLRVIVDRNNVAPDAVVGELSIIPEVHSVECLPAREDCHYDVFDVSVAYPVEENCWTVICALKEKAYIEYVMYDVLTGDECDKLKETAPFLEWQSDYEVIHYWNRLLVDYDPVKYDTGRLTETLKNSGFADEVFEREGTSLYLCENPPGIDSLMIDVRAPYQQNQENLLRLLEPFADGITAVSHPTTGCGNQEEGDFFTFDNILALVDLTMCDADTALRELRELPHVNAVMNLQDEDDDFPVAVFLIEVEVPTWENGPAVLRAVKQKDYVADAQFDRLAIEGPESENTVFPYGDVNRDGQVGADDARAILRYSVRLEHPKDYLIQILADVDCSGSVTAADARLALRTAVGLNAKNYYTYSTPKYAGLIAGKSLELTRQGDRLLLTASTTGSNKVTKCGFTYVKLQKLVNGVWTDLREYTYRDQFNSTNAKVFSVSVVVPKGYTYRAVCEHYAEAPYLQLFTQSASYYNTTNAVTM